MVVWASVTTEFYEHKAQQRINIPAHEIRQIAHPESWAAVVSHTIKLNESLGMFLYVLSLSNSTVNIPEDKGQ